MIEVEVTGDGKTLASGTAAVSPENNLIKMTLEVLPGNRTFSVLARDEAGELHSEGKSIVEIVASGGGTPQVVTVVLEPVQIPSTTALALPTLSINDVSVTEGSTGATTTNAVFTVTLSKESTALVTVDFATADDTAVLSALDYVAASGVLTFPPGTTSQAIAVAVNGDIISESDETFFLNLSNPVNATLSDAQGIRTILDDDVPLPLPTTISINDFSVTEGDAGNVNAVFSVILSEASAVPVSVNFATADGTRQRTHGLCGHIGRPQLCARRHEPAGIDCCEW